MHIFGRKTPKSVFICYLWLSIEVRLVLWRWALGKMSASIALLWPSENVPQVSEVMIIRVIVEVLCEPSIVDFQGERVFSKKGSDAIELDSAWQCLTRSNILNYLILQLHSMFSSTLTITIKLILNQWGLTPMWRVIPSYRNLLSGSLWEHAAMYGVSLARQPHPEPGSILLIHCVSGPWLGDQMSDQMSRCTSGVCAAASTIIPLSPGVEGIVSA